MAAAAIIAENKVPKEQSLGELRDITANKAQELETSKAKIDKKGANQRQIKENKVNPRTKTASKKKSNNVRTAKTLLEQRRKDSAQPTQPAKKSARARTRKENTKFRKKKKKSTFYINGDEQGSMTNHRGKSQQHRIPLVPPSPSAKDRARSPVKYTLKRAESNRVHHMRVLSNKRRFGRRNRTTIRQKQSWHKYFVDFWREPDMKLDDLSSLDCGSYSDNVEELSTTKEAGKVEDLFSLPIPSDFVFNINAPEFIPKKQANIFTVNELVESLKGQELPSMPVLESSLLVA